MFEEENFERKMFVDVHVSRRVHIQARQTLSLFFFFKRIVFNLFFALFYYSLLFLKFEGGVGYKPRNPPQDPPMS